MTQPVDPTAGDPYAAAPAAPVTPAPVEAAPAAAAPAPAAVPEPVTVPAEDSGDVLHASQCVMCKQHDDHPKHIFVLNPVTGEETRRHMDCCASVGCPICADTIKDSGGVIGHELRAHIVARAAAQAADA
jgi:hypothetical protein